MGGTGGTGVHTDKLPKDTKSDVNKWRHSPRPRIRTRSLVTMETPPKATYRFHAVVISIAMTYCAEIEKNPSSNSHGISRDTK